MIHAYCGNQTFLLTALDGTSMRTKPNNFNDIPDKYMIDPTYKMAVKAGALKLYETPKQADTLAEAEQAKPAAKPAQKGAKKAAEGK